MGRVFDDPFSVLHFLAGFAARALLPRWFSALVVAGYLLYEAVSAVVKRDDPAADIVEFLSGWIFAEALGL